MIHLSVRLAWHDSGWNGRICQSPHLNSSCVIHDHIRDVSDGSMDVKALERTIREQILLE